MNMSGGSNLTVLSFQYEQHLRHVQEDETHWWLNGQNDSVWNYFQIENLLSFQATVEFTKCRIMINDFERS